MDDIRLSIECIHFKDSFILNIVELTKIVQLSIFDQLNCWRQYKYFKDLPNDLKISP